MLRCNNLNRQLPLPISLKKIGTHAHSLSTGGADQAIQETSAGRFYIGYLLKELRQAIFEDLGAHELGQRRLEPRGIVLKDVRVQLVQVHDEFRVWHELRLLQQGVNVVQNVSGIAIERL